MAVFIVEVDEDVFNERRQRMGFSRDEDDAGVISEQEVLGQVLEYDSASAVKVKRLI